MFAGRQKRALLLFLQVVTWTIPSFGAPQRALAQADASESYFAPSRPTLVIGFTGGFIHSDDLRHSERQLAQHLEHSYGDRVTVAMFENRQLLQAHKMVLDWLDKLHPIGLLHVREQPRIILYGHSWGASAVVCLARDLDQDHVPVSLTVQVDSIRKHREDDSVIPANVAEAINFYQPGGILHGQANITAADSSHTRILGNYRFSYRHEPAACHAYPWRTRIFFKGHTAIECDPHVWYQIETLIEDRLADDGFPAETEVAQTK